MTSQSNAQLQTGEPSNSKPSGLEKYDLFPGTELHVFFPNGSHSGALEAKAGFCDTLQLHLRDRQGEICDALVIRGGTKDAPLNILHSLFQEGAPLFREDTPPAKNGTVRVLDDATVVYAGPTLAREDAPFDESIPLAVSENRNRQLQNSTFPTLFHFLTHAEKLGCEVRSELGKTPEEIARNFNAIADAHLPTLEEPKKVKNYTLRDKRETGTQCSVDSLKWIDLDLSVPNELHDVDDFRDRLVEMLQKYLAQNHKDVDTKSLTESFVGDCRVYAVLPSSSSRIDRERIFVLMSKDLIVTAHDGKSNFLEQHHAHYYGDRARQRPNVLAPGDFFLNLYEHGLSVNRRVVQELDDRVVTKIKNELQKPGERLSEETIRVRIPEISSALDHLRRKLTEESSVLSGLARQLTNDAAAAAFFRDKTQALERLLRVKQDIIELSERTLSMSNAITQAKDSNIALLTMQGGEIAKKIAILGAAAIPLTMAFAAAAIPECPASWKVPLVASALSFGAVLIGVAQRKKWL